MNDYYIVSVDPRNIIDKDVAMFCFLNQEDFSVDDIRNHISNNQDKNNMMYLIYYMGQFNTINDDYDFKKWFNYVKSKITIIADGCGYSFVNDFERDIISLGIAVRTFYFKISYIKESDLNNIFTDDFTGKILNIDYHSLSDEMLFSLYYVSFALTEFYKKSCEKNISKIIKLIHIEEDIRSTCESIAKEQQRKVNLKESLV